MDNLIDTIATLSPQKRALLELRLRQKGSDISARETIPRIKNRDSLPLSFAQQRLWFLDQLEPNSPLYNIARAVRLSGSLNLEALQKSLDAIVARHEALRTVFNAVDGNPLQVIAENRPVELTIINLCELDVDPETKVQPILEQDVQRPFNLSSDLMLRATLLRLAESDHVLLLVMHHVASDGWSLAILVDELAALYGAFSKNHPSPLPDLPIQYADFAAWQRHYLQGKVLEARLSYWKSQLSGAPSLELPTDRPRSGVQTFRGARKSLVLPKTLSDELQAISRDAKVTLFMTLLAAFQTLLSRYTGQEDVVVGSPIANRTRSEIEGLIGFFVNTLVLRTDLSGNPSFRELMARVSKAALDAYEHQDLPFEKLVEELNPDRNLNRTPFFQVMFALQNARRSALELPGLQASPIAVDSRRSKFDLTLSITEKSDLLTASLEYATDLFEDRTIDRMLNHFQTLLESIAANPDQRLSELAILTEVERHQLLVEWNKTQRDNLPSRCIHELFEAQVERSPDAVAVAFEGKELTYRGLNQSANQVAHQLKKLGVGPEVRIVLFMDRSLEMVVGLLGILKAGGAFIPLDPADPQNRLRMIMEDANPFAVVTCQRLTSRLPDNVTPTVVCLGAELEEFSVGSDENPTSEVIHTNTAYAIYTSGSTGTPKGVLISHGSLVQHALDVLKFFELNAPDCVLQFSALNFDASLEQILPTLISGGRLVLRDSEIWNPEAFWRRISELRISVANLPTAYWHELAQAQLDPAEWAIPKQLRLVVVGGEAISPAALEYWQQLPLSDVRLLNAYGPTETTITATTFEIGSSFRSSRTIPIGRPLGYRSTYILDRYGHLVPVGVTGELHIGGGSLARGYLSRPDLTAEKFIPDSFGTEPGARLYKTGDLARYRTDGSIEFVGRKDHQIKVRGFRVELGEIESVLSQHPAIQQVAVLFWKDEHNENRLVAYVTTKKESAPTASELRKFMKSHLPDYMVPSTFVFLDSLPLTTTGKIDRRALPPPDQSRPELEEAFVAPRTPLESEIARIWCEILKLERVGIHDNFFDLGGHSLLATRLISRVREVLHTDVPLRSLFENPTVATFTAEVAQIQAKDSAPKIAELLANLESLSEEDAQRLLAEQSVKNT